MVQVINTFYKLIVLSVDPFETSIVDERNFGTRHEAEEYASHISHRFVKVIVTV